MNSQPKEVIVKGKTYRIHPLAFEEMGELQSWIDRQQRDHVMAAVEEAVERGKMPIDVLKFMSMAALEVLARNRIALGTAEADAQTSTIDGITYMAYLGIKKGDPTFKFEDTVPIAKAMLEQAMGQSIQMQVAQAVDVIGAEDPKSTATENGSPTSVAPQKSEWIGGHSTPSSSKTRT